MPNLRSVIAVHRSSIIGSHRNFCSSSTESVELARAARSVKRFKIIVGFGIGFTVGHYFFGDLSSTYEEKREEELRRFEKSLEPLKNL